MGDHQTIIINFDTNILLGTMTQPIQATYLHGIHSQAAPTVAKFCCLALKACDQALISERITAIEQLPILSAKDHQALDEIDNNLTQCLIHADQHCRQINDSP